MSLRFSHPALLSAALAVALVCATPVPAAPAAPSSADVASSRAALERALADNEKAQASAEEASRRVATASARLDRLMVAQTSAQRSLDAQVAATYRLGDASFITLLTGATTYENFVNRWLFLVRFNRQSAATLVELKAIRQRTTRTARDLLGVQTRALARMNAIEEAVAQARTNLRGSTAALAEYQRRTAARAAARRAAPIAVQPGPAPSAASAPSAPKAADAGSSQPASSLGWKSARVSNYGPGSYGHRTADGTTITKDSMIVAHKTLPFGTLVEFEYGGRRAVASVADRGPYIAGREFDLGPGVARTLGLNGVYTVRYRVIGR